MLFRKLLTAAGAILIPAIATAQNPPVEDPFAGVAGEPVKVSLVAEQNAVVPGQKFSVAVRMEHAEHWHTYWRNPGFPGKPTEIKWTLPDGFTASDTLWPIPKVLTVPEIGTQHLFEGLLYIVTEITPAPNLKAGENIELTADVSWLECRAEECIDREATLKLSIPVAQQAEKVPAHAESFDAVRKAQPVPVDSGP